MSSPNPPGHGGHHRKAHFGTLKSISGSDLILTDKAGKDHSFTAAPGCVVSLDAMPSSLGALKAGMECGVVQSAPATPTTPAMVDHISARSHP